MKLYTKFKQLKREIKLVIITALIASCIGVYATGECIISATADDVTYKNTTVQDAIDDLFSMSQNYCPPGYECTEHNYVRDCDNNKIYTTTPNNLSGLAKIMSENAYLDNGKSEFVTSCSGVNFRNISSNTNGKGIYEIASTKNYTYPIYYYRGAVNNNVKFAGFCWKAIRTTDTGGVKMIYNGSPDASGNCTNTTGDDTQISVGDFNTNWSSPSDAGYMYRTRYTNTYKSTSQLNTPYVYGNDVAYSGGTYTLTDTITSTGTWSNDYNKLNNNHYTCFSTGTTCSSVYYIYNTSLSHDAYYITLINGKKVEDAIYDMLNTSNVNTNSSTIKTAIDTWYNTNLTSYTPYIEDTVYCNDRSISELNGWDPDGGDMSKYLRFSSYTRTWINYSPSLTCSRALDKFSVSESIGNGKLTYPVGLITSDEVMYAGGKVDTSNNTYYLYTNQTYWAGSPYNFGSNVSSEITVNSTGNINYNFVYTDTNGIRPVISLKSTDIVESGDGTATNPYVIKTN